MNVIKKTASRTKKFVTDHKVAIAVTTTAAVTAIVVKTVIGTQVESMHDFLEREGLLGEFYATFEDKI